MPNHHPTVVFARKVQLIKDAIRLPPPVVFGLRELGLTIVAVQVWVQRVVALADDGPVVAGILTIRQIHSYMYIGVNLTGHVLCCADNRPDRRRETRAGASASSADRRSNTHREQLYQ